jgi:uncharacterized YccA/Bax inhibitor family protein
MQSNNPLFNRDDAFTRNGYATFGSAPATEPSLSTDELQAMYDAPPAGPRMTLDDVVAKSGMIFGVGAVGVLVAWALGFPPALTWGGLIVGTVLSFVNIFKRQVVPGLVLAYAFAEGLFLGGISDVYMKAFPDGVAGGVNIVLAAVVGTVAAFAGTLILYTRRAFRVSSKFKQVMQAASVGILMVFGVSLLFALFGGGGGIFGNGPLGLVFCAGMVVFGAFSLMLDFDSIEQGVAAGAPAQESWRAAFGLALTLVFLYFYILRLLAILNSD